MTVDPRLESRIQELHERLALFREVESRLGIDLERPVRSLRDGYPENSVTLAGRIIEALLKHVWQLKGISGDPARKTLQDLMNGCKDHLNDRTVRDHIESIQATRNRAGHDGGVVVDEDAFDVLRRLSTVLDWFVTSFGPVDSSEDDEELHGDVRDQLEFVVGLYRVLGYGVVERFAFSARTVYLLLQRQQGIRTEYKELILSEDLVELSAVAASRGTPLFTTRYPTNSRLIALGRGRWADDDLPDEIRDAEVLRYDDLPGQFLDYRTYRRTAIATRSLYEGRRDLPVGGQLLRLDTATHEYSVEAVEDAQVLLQDLFLVERSNVLLIGRPGSGKSEQLRRLFLAATRSDQSRIAFRFDLAAKPREQTLEEYLSATLAQHFSVPRHAVFPLYAYLSRSGRVCNIFDGIDEACPTGSFAEFMDVFAAIAELLSVESQIIMSSRIAFLEDSPYIRQLLNRDALISEQVVNDVAAVGIDPLQLPRFSVLRLTDVHITDVAEGGAEGGLHGTPLEHHMLHRLSGADISEVYDRSYTFRSATVVSRFVERSVAASPLPLGRIAEVFGRAFLQGRETFTVVELFNELGSELFAGGLSPGATTLPELLSPLGGDRVRFHHRVLQEYLAARYLVDHLDEVGEPANVTEQVRGLFHSLSPATNADDGIVGAGTYLVGPGDGLRLHQVRRPFRVERDPVTNREYRDFLAAAEAGEVARFEHPAQPADVGHEPAEWRMLNPGSLDDPRFDDHPVTCISWWSAHAYSCWRGGRLLDSVEWECAARGVDGRLFPWGDEVDVRRANAADYWANSELLGYEGWKRAVDNGVLRRAGTTPVDLFATNVSPVGARGMVGNVWEWTETHDTGEARAVICGGSYDNPFRGIRTYSKGVYRLAGVSNVVGFRWGEDV